ncbi:MAG TPA: retropepsin-like aspartic protease [Thermosynechococcaceae cyanobacterium]
MLPFRSSAVLALVGGLLVGCQNPTKVAAPPAVVEAPVSVRPSVKPIATPRQSDFYLLGSDKADSAVTISQSAQSQDDWKLVVSQWQQAVQLMKAVPANSPNHAQAKKKILEYQRNLAMAQQRASRIASAPVAAPGVTIEPYRPPATASNYSAPPSAANGGGQVYRARIKRRAAETPVIDVTFNGSQTFEMILDTGASGTVITEQMAAALKVQVVGKAKVSTASDRSVEVPLAYVDSIAVGGASVREVTVAIGQALDVGLLGHDFLSAYDVTIKRDVVEFRPR